MTKKDPGGVEELVIPLKYLLLIKFIEAKKLIQEDTLLSPEEKEEGLLAVKELIPLIGRENAIIKELGVNYEERQLLLQFREEVKEGSVIHQRLGELFGNKVVMYITKNFIDEFIKGGEYNLTPDKPVVKKDKKLTPKDKKLTQMAIHTVVQMYGDNKQLSFFSDEKIEAFSQATGLNITNRPDSYGVVLNQSQRRVMEGILKAFSDSNYKGIEKIDKATALREIYSDTETSAKTLVKENNAPYKNIDNIPVVRLTQAEIIALSGYDRTQGDKTDVTEAISFLATKQFCFYWVRSKTINGKIAKDKSGNYIKEEVMEVGSLFRIKTVRNEIGELQYYEIQPSAPMLDQVNNYFLYIPNNWREEVKQITGKRASSYTYEFLFWLRLQYEQIRRYNDNGGKNRKPKPFLLYKRWEEVAIALKMPETMYKANRKRASQIIKDAYEVAIKLGYLLKVEDSGATDILYLNEDYYPKPGKLI